MERLGERYRNVQQRHDAIIRAAIDDADGREVSTEGDSFFAVFPTPTGALRAAVHAQRELSATEWSDEDAVRVRMGLHTGDGVLGGDNYLGLDVNRAARIAAAAHGGQVLLSDATRALVERSLRADLAAEARAVAIVAVRLAGAGHRSRGQPIGLPIAKAN